MLFPEKYVKPVLTDIIDASQNGWAAVCTGGTTPASGANSCNTGGYAGSAPLCPGNGGSANGGRLFNSGSSSQSRLINPGDVSRGL